MDKERAKVTASSASMPAMRDKFSSSLVNLSKDGLLILFRGSRSCESLGNDESSGSGDLRKSSRSVDKERDERFEEREDFVRESLRSKSSSMVVLTCFLNC